MYPRIMYLDACISVTPDHGPHLIYHLLYFIQTSDFTILPTMEQER